MVLSTLFVRHFLDWERKNAVLIKKKRVLFPGLEYDKITFFQSPFTLYNNNRTIAIEFPFMTGNV